MIVALNGMIVSRFEFVPASKSGSKHKDSGFGCMKIGDKAIDDLKIKTWIDENIVFTLSFASFGPIFKRTSNGSADGDDAMAGGFGGLNGGDSLRRNMEPFGMHVVVFDIIATDREKSAETNVESKIIDLDAFSLELGDE